MANTVVVEMSAKDAEQVAAWQRARNNVQAFEDQLDKTHHKSKSFTEGLSEGFDESTGKVIKFATSFALVEKGVELVIEKYREWGKEITELAEKMEQQQQKVGEQMALQGRMKEAPEILEATKSVHALDEEKKSVMEGLTRANPKLSKEQIIDLEKHLAPQGEIYSPENLQTISAIAGKLQGIAPKKSGAQIADLALFAASHTEGRFGELADPAAQRSMRLLMDKAGFSAEKALAFQITGVQHEMRGNQLESVAQSLTKNEDMAQLAKHARSREGIAKFKFYQEHDASKRLQMLTSDEATRKAVLGEANAERLSGLGSQEIAGNQAQIEAAEKEGFGRTSLKQWAATNPTLHESHRGKVFGEMKGHDLEEMLGIPELLAKQRAEDEAGKYDTPAQKMDRELRHKGELAGRLSQAQGPTWIGKTAHFTGLTGAITGETREQTRERRAAEQARADEHARYDQKWIQEEAAEASGGAAPAADRQVKLLERQTALLEKIADKNHTTQVAVNVHGGGGGSVRRDFSTRNDHSPAMPLAAIPPHGPHSPGDGAPA